MRRKFKTCLLAALLISPVLSLAMTNQPKYCPGIAAIKSVPVTKAEYSSIGGWVAYNPKKNKYDTADEWTFMIMLGRADTESDAITKGNQDIALIERVNGPMQSHDGKDEWSCFYFGGNERDPAFIAMAATPPYMPLSEFAASFRR